MKRGPKPTPTDELTSWRKELAARKDEVKAEILAECPAPPKFLQGRAREFWSITAAELYREGMLTALDLPAVALLCIRLADVERLEAELQGEGVWLATKDGVKANPLWRALDTAMADCRRLFADLGLTPTARIGLPRSDRKVGAVMDARAHFPKG